MSVATLALLDAYCKENSSQDSINYVYLSWFFITTLAIYFGYSYVKDHDMNIVELLYKKLKKSFEKRFKNKTS